MPLEPRILIASVELPGSPPIDPADRMLCATARDRGLAAMIRDEPILGYGAAGFVNTVAC